jgi:hypothetical protein
LQLFKASEDQKRSELASLKTRVKSMDEERQQLQMSLNEKADRADKSKKRLVESWECMQDTD